MAALAQPLLAGPAFGARQQSTGPTFTFEGGGWGHGVGMSQWGAMRRAQEGQDARQILAAYYPGAAITKRSQSDVSVLIDKTDATSLQFTGAARITSGKGTLATLRGGETVQVRARNNGIEVQVTSPGKKAAQRVSGKDKVVVTTTRGTVRVSATGHQYRDGRVVIRLDSAGRLELVNEGLTMQEYLYGLGEMPASWPSDSLQAQAIAARTYTYRRVANPRSSTYDIDSTTIDQAFNGADIALGDNGKRWTDAVDATNGQILTYDGAPIEALYSASNGGYITAGGYVFGTDQPYLRDDVDPFDDVPANPLHEWTRQYTGAELGQFLATARNVDIGTVTAVSFSGNVSTTGRIDRADVKLTGTRGATTITGAQFKAMINQSAPQGRRLPSTLLFLPAFGAVDAVTVSKGALEVSGWVGLRGSTAMAVAQVSIDGKVMATAPGTVARPDVARRIGTGATPGFHVEVPLPKGTTAKSKVCVSASMPNGASSTVISCRTVPRQANA